MLIGIMRHIISEPEQILWKSPDPSNIFSGSPGICRLASGRLAATHDIRGPGMAGQPGIAVKSNSLGIIWLSDDHGRSWRKSGTFPFFHARPFSAGKSLYILGHDGDLMIMKSDDDGETWQNPARLTSGQQWHQAPCNVHYANGCVYLIMERKVYDDIRGWSVSVLAPVLMRAPVEADLTERISWTFASETAFRDIVDTAELDHHGLPFFSSPAKNYSELAPGRYCAPAGWLETNVVQFRDPGHYWFDPDGKTIHLWMRAHTGMTGYAAIAKVIEQGDTAGTGEMVTTLESAPSGKTCVYVPCPGGQMKFHVVYDEKTSLYWLLSTQATDSMTRAELLGNDRYNLPDNQRSRLQLSFSRNMIDWCFAGMAAIGGNERASRHYASMIIDNEDLIVLSRSGDEHIRNKEPQQDAHEGNLVTVHRVPNFRELVY
ncbi:MAG: exo-alpha-sialidase [Spirochaetales bacterium]|nr:exo-alpha-sialidase [Spirochaetales bacterium]